MKRSKVNKEARASRTLTFDKAIADVWLDSENKM